MRRVPAGLVLPALLVLTAACGGGGAADAPQDRLGTIDDVTVTVTGFVEATPKIEFSAPLKFAETEAEVLDKGPGNGDAVNDNSMVTLDYLGVNASDGATIDSSYDTGKPATFQPADTIEGFATGLQGARAGDRVVIAVASKDGYDPTGKPEVGVRPGDSLIFVVDVIKVVNPTPIPRAQLPSVKQDKDGDPVKFLAKPDTPKSVPLLETYVVRAGDGPKVEADDTLTVEYLGQVWPDGAVFDESYSKKKPVSFPLTDVIEGWSQGLLGQQVGSQVILTIPSDLAYGEAGQGSVIPPNADLIFLIDIVDAK